MYRDHTRTSYIVSCVKKLHRHKKLEELGKFNKQTIEDVFKNFKPVEQISIIPDKEETQIVEPCSVPKENNLEVMIKDITDMFPHLGDGN